MNLRYIVGGSGSGKTTTCLGEISNELKTENTHPLIYIVPEQFSLQSEKNLIGLSPEQSIMRVQVLSFGRLAYHLFAEMGTGALKAKLLSDIGKTMLLRKIVNELSSQLVFFGKSVDKQGFIENLSDTISEFYKYDISLESLETYMSGIVHKENLHLKMRDIYLIFKGYRDYIDKHYLSTDETLDLLCKKINDSDYLTGAEIWIDGFSGFTPQEFHVIEKLLLKATQVNITFPIKTANTKLTLENIKPTDPFFESKNNMVKLNQFTGENRISCQEPVLLDKAIRVENAPALAFLENHYLGFHKKVYDADIGSEIKIVQAANKYEEINHLASAIIELVRETGYLYKDIGILTGDIEGYEVIMKNSFSQYDIPVFMDAKKDIFSHPLTELIRSAIDIVVHNWSYESVFRFLKTSFTSMERDDIDILENYVLAYGIKGYKWFLNEWNFGFSELDENSVLAKAKINDLKKNLMDNLLPFTESLSGTKKLTVRVFSTGIFKMLDHLKVTEKLEQYIMELQNIKNELLAKEYSQIYGKICTVFDKLVEILGDESMTLKEFAKILDAGLAETNLGLIPPSQDGVLCGDLRRSRFPEIKVLFLIGVNDGIFLKNNSEQGLFSDEDRSLLTMFGMELAPDFKQKMYEEQFLLYNAVTKPAEKLILSYSIGNLDGKSMRAHALINKIKKMFPRLTETLAASEHIISGPKHMFSQVAHILKKQLTENAVTEDERILYSWFLENETYKAKLLKMEDYILKKDIEETLSPESVKKLYGKEIVTGVSRLEKYMKCPFSYFVQYNLKGNERNVFHVQSVDIGNLFHGILELFTRRLVDTNISWRELTKEQINLFVDESADEIAPSLASEVLLSTSRLQYMIKRVKRISKKSIWALSQHIKSGEFEFYGAELEFKKDTALSSIEIIINSEYKMTLTGRIDRIDVLDFEGNRYVKIIDYKSGNTKFDLEDIYFGTQLQLMLYMDALIKNGKEFFGAENIKGEILPGGVFYFNIDDPILTQDGQLHRDVLDDMVLKTFKMSGLVLKDPAIVQKMDRDIDGYSKIIPVQITKDGSISAKSSAADLTEFNSLRSHVNEKIKEIGAEILKGNISVYPYKGKKETGCTYCNFSSICGFELKDKKKYNN